LQKIFQLFKKRVEIFLSQYPNGAKFRIYTLYFGGGTPSLIEPEFLADFLSFLKIILIFQRLKNLL